MLVLNVVSVVTKALIHSFFSSCHLMSLHQIHWGNTGKGMDVDPQMLGDASKTVLLRAYFHRGYKYDVIVQMLQQYHGK